MKIAVTYENGKVFQHFGKSEQFKFYTVSEGKVLSGEVLSTEGNGHSALADLLSDWGVSTLICGGIGAGARNALSAAGIAVMAGVSGNADEQIEAYLNNQLEYDPAFECSHHEHEHHNSPCGHRDNCGCHQPRA